MTEHFADWPLSLVAYPATTARPIRACLCRIFVDYGWIYARVPVTSDAAHPPSPFSSAIMTLAHSDGLELGLALNQGFR